MPGLSVMRGRRSKVEPFLVKTGKTMDPNEY